MYSSSPASPSAERAASAALFVTALGVWPASRRRESASAASGYGGSAAAAVMPAATASSPRPRSSARWASAARMYSVKGRNSPVSVSTIDCSTVWSSTLRPRPGGAPAHSAVSARGSSSVPLTSKRTCAMRRRYPTACAAKPGALLPGQDRRGLGRPARGGASGAARAPDTDLLGDEVRPEHMQRRRARGRDRLDRGEERE